ncbi:STAS domain-containing protein [Methylacidimicrobium sp. B4]|uniref:STAS domain-containing protein n=1 Tax=Methylacidimicrobium sp. B4 TaxID=2796139 RepID=UPI001A8CFE63|nr:STAS domain-containing protein [Methylacidimicrobium sp. B4]QSR85642.1 STAS domain-containing protein [Methylacidimicrobium sp. B4]
MLKVIGAGSFEHSFSLRQYCENFIQCGSERFLVDLTECTYLDSTFLGTLAGPALKLRKTGGTFQVAGSSRRVAESIRTLGLDRLFECVEHLTPYDAGDLRPLESGAPHRETTGELLLQAHQTLLECDPKNAPKFQDLVSYLSAEVGRRNRPESS